jgi:hypothetical protein
MSKSLRKIQWGWACIEPLNKWENLAKTITLEKWLTVTAN